MVKEYNSNPDFGIPILSQAPEIEAKDVDGRPFSLNSAYTQKPILLNFFRGHY